MEGRGGIAVATYNRSIQNRLSRAEGQLRGVQKMIEEDKDCAAVLPQLSAIRASVDRVMGMIVAENLKACLENPAIDPDEQTRKIEQAISLIVKK